MLLKTVFQLIIALFAYCFAQVLLARFFTVTWLELS